MLPGVRRWLGTMKVRRLSAPSIVERTAASYTARARQLMPHSPLHSSAEWRGTRKTAAGASGRNARLPGCYGHSMTILEKCGTWQRSGTGTGYLGCLHTSTTNGKRRIDGKERRPLHYSVMPYFNCPGRWHIQLTLWALSGIKGTANVKNITGRIVARAGNPRTASPDDVFC